MRDGVGARKTLAAVPYGHGRTGRVLHSDSTLPSLRSRM